MTDCSKLVFIIFLLKIDFFFKSTIFVLLVLTNNSINYFLEANQL